jgi:hypothetical protein
MGLLDDAIREHLDLKRRRGGDPAEIARAEQEALGPVRREPEQPAADGADPPGTELPSPQQPVAEEPSEAASAPADEASSLFDAPLADAPPQEPPAHDEPRPDPRESDLVHQPTTEFHVEDHHDDEEDAHAAAPAAHGTPLHEAPAPHDEDVLEETPDFLQETPEHDRLWFEQRPPRDFDFDA